MPQAGAIQADASQLRLNLAARLRTTRRAIATSFQQPDRWILVDRRLNIGKETSQTRILLARRHSMRQGLSMNFNQLKPTPEQRRES
jgi:hypothetical protein